MSIVPPIDPSITAIFEEDYGPDADAVEPEHLLLDQEPLRPSGFLEWFVIAQTAVPALLFLPGSQALRLPIRVSAYMLPFVGLGLWWMRAGADRPRHPAQGWLLGIGACLGLMILHPLTNSLQAGAAQALLYISIFCPLFWAPSFVNRPRVLVRVLAILLVCNGINSVVGVLQVYDPDRWMPRELSFVFAARGDALAAATYAGPDGRMIVRPPGLFDTPGAVCGPGTIAALLGLIFSLERLQWWKRAIALGLSLAGVSAIYLSHVRANFIVALGMMAAYVIMLALQGQKQRAVSFVMLGTGIVTVGLAAATMLGGESIGKRFSTLLEEDPREIYFSSRGNQVQYGLDQLAVEYPFGAGLARCGMMRGYFGDPSNLDSSELWAEVQPNAWILDGGVVLLGLYTTALLVVLKFETGLVRSLWFKEDRRWASAVCAANLGTLALVLTFVPFTTQVGMQFWFLEGALLGALLERPRK